MGSKLLLLVSLLSASYIAYRLSILYPIVLPTITLPESSFSLKGRSGTCRKIHDVDSDRLRFCEDLTEWEDIEGNMIGVLVSCDPGRREWNTVMGPLKNPDPRGDLWFIDTSSNQATHLPLGDFPVGHDFHPLGVSVLPSRPKESTTLFAVNHGRRNSTIEVFDLSPPSLWFPPALKYRRTITHASLVSPNAVYGLTPATFLVSQDHTFTRRLPPPLSPMLPVTETLLALPGGSVDYVDFSGDGPRLIPAVRNIPFANGIAVSLEKNELAVSSSSGLSIHFYHITPAELPASLPLRRIRTVPLIFSPDNLSYSHSGILYASGHPNFPALVQQAKSAKDHAPSWVSAINGTEVKTVYQSRGDPAKAGFSSSTTAVVDEARGRLWVSGLYEDGVLLCEA